MTESFYFISCQAPCAMGWVEMGVFDVGDLRCLPIGRCSSDEGGSLVRGVIAGKRKGVRDFPALQL